MGTLKLKRRSISKQPWRLVFVPDNQQEKNLVYNNVMGGSYARDNITFALRPDIPLAIGECIGFGNLTIEQDLQDWLTDLKAKTEEALSTRVRNRVELNNVSFADRLYDYQTIGVAWLSKVKRGILADDPGLGKTWQGIAAAEEVQSERTLILTINETVALQWGRAIEELLPHKTIAVAVGAKGKRLDAIRSGADYVVATISTLAGKEYPAAYRRIKWTTIIVDEAHKLQGRKSKSFTTMRRLRSEYLFLLTGTPIWNKTPSLWALLSLIEPNRFSSFWAFVDHYCIVKNNAFGRQITGVKPGMKELLKRDLANFMLRREMHEVKTELPDAIFTVVPWIPNKQQTDIIKKMKKDYALVWQNKMIKMFEGASGMLATARRICNHPPLAELTFQSPKTKTIKELVDSIEGKTLIFVWHRDYAKHLASELNCNVVLGGMDARSKNALVEDFRGDGNCLLVATLGSLGTGVDLPEIPNCVFAELDWTSANIEQGWRRIYRVNSTGAKNVYFVVGKGTIEENIYTCFKEKKVTTAELLAQEL